MTIGCDTGFFVEFILRNPTVRQLTQEAAQGEHALVTSVVCIYELKKLGLKGMLSKNAAFQVATDIPLLYDVVFLDDTALPIVDQAVRLAHGNGLSMADALILSSVLSKGATRLYTVDRDMTKYRGNIEVINLRN